MATLYARIREKNRYTWKQVEFSARDGQPIAPRGTVTSYSIRYRRAGGHGGQSRDIQRMFPAGKTLAAAMAAYREFDPANPPSRSADPETLTSTDSEATHGDRPGVCPDRKTVETAVAEYLAHSLTRTTYDYDDPQRLSPSSLKTYKHENNRFREFCKRSRVIFLDQITGTVLLNYWSWFRTAVPRRRRGSQQNTLANSRTLLSAFLGFHGIPLVKTARTPNGLLESTARIPEHVTKAEEDKQRGILSFTEEDIQAMKMVATVDEADFVQFALATGFREQEIAHAEYGDIDWTGRKRQSYDDKKAGRTPVPNIITGLKERSSVMPKGFETKNGRSRVVPIPSLIERLRARQERQKEAGITSSLIFPSKVGRPQGALIVILQKLVRRAKEERDHTIAGEIGLHRFRKTFATWMLAHSRDILAISRLLGHSDVETTKLYLAVDNTNANEASLHAFAAVGD